MNASILFECLLATGRLSGMIMLIMVGADIYAYFLSISKIPMSLVGLMTFFTVSKFLALSIILVIYLVLGCFLDAIAMIVLTIPIFFPLTQSLGLDPIWLGVIVVMTMEIGLITPPVGMNVFVIRGIADDVPITTIFRGIWPFLAASIFAIIIIILAPPLATFIPSRM